MILSCPKCGARVGNAPFAVLFFDDLVRDGWKIEIEPYMRTFMTGEHAGTTVAAGVVVTFEKETTTFSGHGRDLEKAIEDARQTVIRTQAALQNAQEKHADN